MRQSRIVGTVALIGALLGVAACSTDSPEENTAQACSAADDLEGALADLEATLTPDATVDEIRDARQQVADAQNALDEAAEDVARDRADALDQAWEQLDDAVDDVDGDATVPEAVDSLRDDAAAVGNARQDLVAELGC